MGRVGKLSASLLMTMFVGMDSRRKISKSPDPVICCSCTAAGVSNVAPPGSVTVHKGLKVTSPVPLMVTVSSEYVCVSVWSEHFT